MKLRARFTNDRPKTPEPTPEPKKVVGDPSVSPAARNLALAHHIARLIDQGLIPNYTAAARLLGVSQPRMTHLMGLLLLAPQIQEAILAGSLASGDKQLRELARVPMWSEQLDLLSRHEPRPQPSTISKWEGARSGRTEPAAGPPVCSLG